MTFEKKEKFGHIIPYGRLKVKVLYYFNLDTYDVVVRGSFSPSLLSMIGVCVSLD
jgi:hypothetical protein